MITNTNLARSVFSQSWLKGWKPLYLLCPSRNAECNVMPLILNAVTPVGAVNNAVTSPGSKVPEAISVHLTLWHATRQHHLGHQEQVVRLNWFTLVYTAFLHQSQWNICCSFSPLLYWSGGIYCCPDQRLKAANKSHVPHFLLPFCVDCGKLIVA